MMYCDNSMDVQTALSVIVSDMCEHKCSFRDQKTTAEGALNSRCNSHHIVQWCHIDLSSLNDRNPHEASQPAYNDLLQESE